MIYFSRVIDSKCFVHGETKENVKAVRVQFKKAFMQEYNICLIPLQ